MDIRAVVVARRRSGRVDPLTPVGGVPMVVRAVRTLLAGAPVEHVLVLAEAHRHDAIARACSGLPVDLREDLPLRAHTGQRAPATPGDGRSGESDFLLLHDAVRPLTPTALVAAVVAAAGDGDVVVPLLPLADTVKLVDADGLVTATPDRAGLRVLQTPHAVRIGPAESEADPFDVAARLAVGGSVLPVAGDPLAFPVHTAWDLELAELLIGGAGR
jgi:2-C-methyl-D-erythritol 4-phosphate cytidylyltransferase